MLNETPIWGIIVLGVVGGLLLVALIGLVVWWRIWIRRIRPPAVTNNGGAANVGPTAAALRGLVTRHGNENPVVHIYWGSNDGGTNPTAWEHDENLGPHGLSGINHRVEGLNPNTTYYYRVYGSNSAGDAWAPASANFTTRAQPPAPPPQASEDERLVQVQGIRGHFRQGGGGELDVRIPSSRVDHQDLQLERWDTTARRIAEAERSSTVGVRVANELFGAARDIKRAKERAQKGFEDEAKWVQKAYQELGLEPPEIRTEEDLRVAERQLVEAAEPATVQEQEVPTAPATTQQVAQQETTSEADTAVAALRQAMARAEQITGGS